MSSGAAEGPKPVEPPQEWQRLETAVRRLIAEQAQLRQRASQAEARSRSLEEALRRFSAGDLDPARIAARMRALEEENRALHRRLEEGRAAIERAMARLEFLEQSR